MNSERWQRVQLLFDAALSQADEKRNAFIESACGDDLALRGEVISLLALHEEGDGIEGLEPTAWLGALAGFKRRSVAVDERIAGRYRIRRRIGRGGMGDVYEAWDEELSIPVALKTLHLVSDTEEAHKHLKLEGLLARSVWHPNVCRVYDLDVHSDDLGRTWFLTMELLRGETLAERLGKCGKLPIDSALRLAEQMAAGLGAAHRAGVVHRDFKPGNVMLVGTGDEQALVTDFGVARAAALRSAEDNLEKSDRVIGTPAYIAPEQVRGNEVGPAADIYALGIVLYEMVTGTLPFAGASPMEVARRRVVESAPSPRSALPELDERWEAVILRCLEREPRRRFSRIEEVSDALAGRAFGEEEIQTLELAGRGWHTLPVERDAFVGREAALEELAATLAGGTRLVTLVGAGGMGKTRLAVRYAWKTLRNWRGGVWFCDLTEARDTNAIASTVAGSLGVQLGQGDPLDQLGHAIAGLGRCLVILDNFEQVAAHAKATVERWLQRAEKAAFLVTSRERLHLDGDEKVQPVGSLSPEMAMELFAARARWMRPSLELVGSEAQSAQEIVRLTDGMPLAIELAAARMRVMSAAEIVAQMRKRFQLLTGGASVRHETLAVTIDGSWELLAPWEGSAWAQCSVFEGGFTLAAAEGVVDLSHWPQAPAMVDVIQSLFDKSLLKAAVPEGWGRANAPETRFGMYVSLQEYARKKLREVESVAGGATGDSAALAAEERHRNWFARYGNQEQLDALDQHGGGERVLALWREMDNLVAACQRAVARGHSESALQTYRAASHALMLRGPFDLVITLGREVMTVMTYPEHRASALFLLGWASLYAGRMEEAQEQLAAALDLFRQLGDRRNEGTVLSTLGILHQEQGRMAEAHATLQHSLTIFRELGNRQREGIVLLNLGECCRKQGQMEEARSHWEAALSICRDVDNRRTEGMLLKNLGIVHRSQGRMEEARAHLEAALVIQRELGNRSSEGHVLNSLGNVYFELGDLEAASTLFQAALTIEREIGNRLLEGITTGNMGSLHLERGDIERAREYYEAALAIFREVGHPFGEGEALASLGTVHLRQGRLDESRAALNQGEEVVRRVGGRMGLALVLCARVELEQRSGNHEAARATLNEADAIAHQLGAGDGSELGRKLAKLRSTLTEKP